MRKRTHWSTVLFAVASASLVSAGAAGPPAARGQAPAPPAFEVYSRFDFVPGEKVAIFEDFSQDAIGDFPAKWNTNASGEIVTIANRPGRWLKLTGGGVFVPQFPTNLPDNFTLEYDMLVAPKFNSGYRINTAIVELQDVKQPAGWQGVDNRFHFSTMPPHGRPMPCRSEAALRQARPRAGAPWKSSGSPETARQFMSRSGGSDSACVCISTRTRFGTSRARSWPRPNTTRSSSSSQTWTRAPSSTLRNIRLAMGAPDTRNKLLTEGQWVTRGILFDVNSDHAEGRVVWRDQGDQHCPDRERRIESPDRRPHRQRRRRGSEPRPVEAARGVSTGCPHHPVQD